MRRLPIFLLVLAAALAPGRTLGDVRPDSRDGTPVVVRIGVESEEGDRRFDFPAVLLEHALRRGGSEAQVQRVSGMNQLRMIQAAREGRLDVLVLPNVRATDVGLRPIPFPLRRGLLGVRVLLARPADAERLSRVETVNDLKRGFVLGYGQGWMDREEILRLGFVVETASSYHGLFDMLRGGRSDYLSRGVSEYQAELADPRLAGTGMVVVPRVALFYPLDDFFYLPSNRGALRAEIDRGLRAMLADGSYNRLLNEHYGEAMRAAKINERIVLHVAGYPVPEGTPLERFDILEPVRSQAIFKE